MSNLFIKLRIVLWLALCAIVVWILWMNVVPSGKIIYINDFSRNYNEFVRKLTPDERVEAITNGTQKIVGDPVYFELRVPRRFTQAKMILRYKNKTNLPIMEAGVLMDKNLGQAVLKSLGNKILDDLSSAGWQEIRESESVLYQRSGMAAEDIFTSIPDFKNNPPERERIALYNFDLSDEYLLFDYEAKPESRDLGIKLRGAYQFYTYIKYEDLNFIFDFIDVNECKGGDGIIINLYYQNQIIDSLSLADDGIVDDKGQYGVQQVIELKSVGLPEGVYRVEVQTSDDIITENISTTQQKISFINKIYLASAGLENFQILTDSTQISALTINPAGLQSISIVDRELKLEKTYEQKDLSTSAGMKEINLKKDGVMLSGNGVFALTTDAFLNPQYRKIDRSIDLAGEGIDYILANYHSPIKEGEWLVASAEFDLSNAYKEFSKHQLLLSIPGLRPDDGTEDYVEIDEIKIELEGATLWEYVKNKL